MKHQLKTFIEIQFPYHKTLSATEPENIRSIREQTIRLHLNLYQSSENNHSIISVRFIESLDFVGYAHARTLVIVEREDGCAALFTPFAASDALPNYERSTRSSNFAGFI